MLTSLHRKRMHSTRMVPIVGLRKIQTEARLSYSLLRKLDVFSLDAHLGLASNRRRKHRLISPTDKNGPNLAVCVGFVPNLGCENHLFL